MSETRYKQALSNIDSDTRICLLHLERQINEIKTLPLKSVSELEKKVLNAISKMEKNNKDWEKIIADFVKMSDEVEKKYTPSFLERMHKEYLQRMEALGKHYHNLFKKEFRDAEKMRDLTHEMHGDIQKLLKSFKNKYKKEHA